MVDTETRIRELEHRFRNILTVVRSLVSQSLQAADSIEDARSTIDERLAALGGAIEQLLTHDWEAAPLPALAEVQQGMAAGYEEVTPSASLEAFGAFARKEGSKGLRLAKQSLDSAN